MAAIFAKRVVKFFIPGTSIVLLSLYLSTDGIQDKLYRITLNKVSCIPCKGTFVSGMDGRFG